MDIENFTPDQSTTTVASQTPPTSQIKRMSLTKISLDTVTLSYQDFLKTLERINCSHCLNEEDNLANNNTDTEACITGGNEHTEES